MEAQATHINSIRKNGAAPVTCFVCNKEIVDDQWFCRLPQTSSSPSPNQPDHKILLCSPACALRHFATNRPNGSDLHHDLPNPSRSFTRSVSSVTDEFSRLR